MYIFNQTSWNGDQDEDVYARLTVVGSHRSRYRHRICQRRQVHENFEVYGKPPQLTSGTSFRPSPERPGSLKIGGLRIRDVHEERSTYILRTGFDGAIH